MVQVPFFLNRLIEKRCHWHGCGHAIEVPFVVVKPCFIPSPGLTGRPFKHRRRRKRKKKRTIPKLKCVRCTAQLSRVDENLQTTVFEHLFSDDRVRPPSSTTSSKSATRSETHWRLPLSWQTGILFSTCSQRLRRKQRRHVLGSFVNTQPVRLFSPPGGWEVSSRGDVNCHTSFSTIRMLYIYEFFYRCFTKLHYLKINDWWLWQKPPKKKTLRIFWVNPRWKPTRARSGSGACHGATPMTSVAASPSANPWESQVEPPVPSLRNTSVELSLVIFPCVEERMKRYFVKFTCEHMRTIHIFRHWFILAFFDIDIYDQDTFPNTWYRCTLHSGRLTWRHFKMFQPCCWDPNKSLQNIIYSKYCMLCYSDILPKLHSNWQNLWQDNVKLQAHGICLKKRHAKVLKEDTQPVAISWVIVGLFGQKAAWAWSSTSQSLMRKHGCCGWCTRQNWGILFMMTSMTCYHFYLWSKSVDDLGWVEDSDSRSSSRIQKVPMPTSVFQQSQATSPSSTTTTDAFSAQNGSYLECRMVQVQLRPSIYMHETGSFVWRYMLHPSQCWK